MINPGQRVLKSSKLSQAFTISGTTGQFGAGGYQTNTPIDVQTRGIITVSSAKELLQVPEGDRVQGAMTFRCPIEIHATRNDNPSGISDKITWRGNVYKIIQVFPWLDYGHSAAIGVRVQGD